MTAPVSNAPAFENAFYVDPAILKKARSIELPIDSVTVFSDRARVTRRATLTLPEGIQALQLPDLPASLLHDSLQFDPGGAELLYFEAEPVTRVDTSQEAEALYQELRALQEKTLRLRNRGQATDTLLSLLDEIIPSTPISQRDDALGRLSVPRLSPEGWSRALSFIRDRRLNLQTKRHGLDREHVQLLDALALLEKRLESHETELRAVEKSQIIVVVRVAKGQTRVTPSVTYTLPGPQWLPVYDVHYDSSTGSVRLEASALVTQSTGEAWPAIPLTLSSGLGQNQLAPPELFTWALGEKQQFLPKARAATWPAALQPVKEPRLEDSPEDLAARAQESHLSRLRQELDTMPQGISTQLQQLSPRTEALEVDTPLDFSVWTGDMGVGGFGARGSGAGGGGHALGIGGLAKRAATISSKYVAAKAIARNTIDLTLFDAEYYTLQPQLADSRLPAMRTGGIVHRWQSLGSVAVASDGEPHKLRLGEEVLTSNPRYETTPGLQEKVYAEARITATSDRPVLGGPANLFIDGEYAGKSEIENLLSKEEMHLALGKDEEIRVHRTIEVARKTEGIFSTDRLSTYEVKIDVVSHKAYPIDIRIHELIPKTRDEEVDIDVLQISPELSTEARKRLDETGLLFWSLRLPPGDARTVLLRYSVGRPEGQRLREGSPKPAKKEGSTP